jgi:hypothetical protein
VIGWRGVLERMLRFAGPAPAGTVYRTTGPENTALIGMNERQHVVVEMLKYIWRLDHPRLAEILEMIGAHYSVKPMANAACKAR